MLNSRTAIMSRIYDYYMKKFHASQVGVDAAQRRIGSELKFPLVCEEGAAVSREVVDLLWSYLQELGWKPVVDGMTKKIVGAQRPGEKNDTIASCETGYCKTEFSLSHVADLNQLNKDIEDLKHLLQNFSEKHRVRFLGYGIHPVSPPGKNLLMKKSRSGVWDKLFGANRHISPENGDDVHLFTVNAASHTHISVAPDEAIKTVNVLNGFAGAQIALNANSSIWKGDIDPRYKCVAEKFWDWWMSDRRRIGVPEVPFRDMRHYIDTVSDFRPVFILRDGKPLLLSRYDSFAGYFDDRDAVAVDIDNKEVNVVPEHGDFDLHCTCYWYNARISRYFTVENRINDQQPPAELMTVPAITLGLVSALDEAWEEVRGWDWIEIRKSRVTACERAMDGAIGKISLIEYIQRMLSVAKLGLERRSRGEEIFLEPLFVRLQNRKCPAEEAERVFRKEGMAGFLNSVTI